MSRLRSFRRKWRPSSHPDCPDLVFVLFKDAKGWILEAICREIAERYPGTCEFHDSASNLPMAKAYFFAHYGFFPPCLKYNPQLWNAKTLVYYTHAKELDISNSELIYALNQCTRVVNMCSMSERQLFSEGVREKKLTHVVGAADPDFLKPHERGDGAIVISSAYYGRKRPELILELSSLLPNRNFLLIGRSWNEFDRFAEIEAAENIEYVETAYENYPALYERADVYVSSARLEGGPIPLLETMMCNIVPVASRTGFAPDVIEHGRNGFLFDIDAPASAIAELVEAAYSLTGDISDAARKYSWDNFASRIHQLAQGAK
ncbi:MAG: glycosyltransferase [Verrucomicrobiota bacterium]